MTQRRTVVFSDSAYPDAARAYARGDMGQKSWDNLMRRPLFQIWLRGVLHHHLEDCAPVVRNKA